ncbi:MAG: hypothetical protein AMXMBFR82_31960 [Candidatus Hydrogenedentota bacterium]
MHHPRAVQLQTEQGDLAVKFNGHLQVGIRFELHALNGGPDSGANLLAITPALENRPAVVNVHVRITRVHFGEQRMQIVFLRLGLTMQFEEVARGTQGAVYFCVVRVARFQAFAGVAERGLDGFQVESHSGIVPECEARAILETGLRWGRRTEPVDSGIQILPASTAFVI